MPAKRPSASDPGVQRKILRFFIENPGSIDTPRGVSTWTGESLAGVRAALEQLADKGWLKAHRTSSTVGYSCVADPKILAQIRSSLKNR